MNKIIVSIIVIGLLLMTSIVSVNAFNIEKETEELETSGSSYFHAILVADVYVDDDADLDWYDETHVKTIKEGIKVAEDGDTVFVYGGVYNEWYVDIDKSINLIGEDRNIPKVRRGVRITADRVNFSGFTFSDISFSEWGVTCIDIWYSASYCNVSGNTFSNISGGEEGHVSCIDISDASYCTVSDNTISNINGKWAFGIDISDASYCIVSDNTISNINGKWAAGILIDGHAEPAAHNTIRGNTIKDISSYAQFAWGISVMDESRLNITGNTISNITSDAETGMGIYIISFEGSRYTLIEGNTVADCDYCCIFLEGIDSYGCTKFNTIKNNTIKGRWPDDRNIGINLDEFVTDTTISKNTIENNSRGIYIGPGCKNNVVSKNIFNYNAEGIAMGRGGYLTGYSSRNKIIANNIENTTNYGIYCERGSKNNKIHHNNLINNGGNAHDVGSSNTWYNAILQEGNYWDDWEDNLGYSIGIYIIPPHLLYNNDLFPSTEPFDIENIDIAILEMTEEMTSEESEELLQEQLNSQYNAESSISTYINSIINLDAHIGSTSSSQPSTPTISTPTSTTTGSLTSN